MDPNTQTQEQVDTSRSAESDPVEKRLQALEAKIAAKDQELSSLSMKLKETTDEAAKRRISEREAKAKADDAEKAAALASGDHAKVIRDLEAKLIGTTSFEEKAKRWDELEASETGRIDGRAAEMPDHFKRLLADARDLSAKRNIVAAFDAELAARTGIKPEERKRPGEPAPAGGAPGGTPPPITLDPRTATDAELGALKAKDEEAYYRAIGGRPSFTGKKTNIFDRIFKTA